MLSVSEVQNFTAIVQAMQIPQHALEIHMIHMITH